MKGLEMVVTSFSSTPPVFFSSSPLSSSNLRGRFTILSSPSFLLNGLRRHQDAKLVGTRARGGAVRVLANPNASSPPPGKVKAKKEVIMVDPLEAKRLASKQMEEIKGRERQQRRRDVEAINGAWAIIGLLIGLVIEAQTGKGILAQLDGYWMRSRKHGQRSHEELLWISNVFERIHFSSPNIVKIHNGRFTKAADISGISGSSMALSCSGLETRVTILFTISPHILEAAGLRRAGVSHMSLVAATVVNFTSIVRMISLRFGIQKRSMIVVKMFC
ncbi:uncharacterized protein LOC103868757 isoform X1 [Brassica rapa]|uniref:uncharacterized protein LOC103868757 isoform X1 n=1 Tax=Brassica campestris TaxID=3711 RepID=UPI00142D63E5|nr:uncharacterized protein LOC103868757 isoform X1 [Brassica rapa]XP_033140128.1 uncharacterized protein LOC103868757 isoform X1 [Brassica rapa]XP_033140132.1 uncharacterized protein LOC103868757 isoform X1 [Brassica rapa]XP_033140136.1 uncharacterized protein LOC103868757 isoform X1 [Brassica rapa]